MRLLANTIGTRVVVVVVKEVRHGRIVVVARTVPFCYHAAAAAAARRSFCDTFSRLDINEPKNDHRALDRHAAIIPKLTTRFQSSQFSIYGRYCNVCVWTTLRRISGRTTTGCVSNRNITTLLPVAFSFHAVQYISLQREYNATVRVIRNESAK
jgi:hypothetical protein